MNKALNGAIVAIGIAGACFVMTIPASADGVGVGVHVGDVGVGVGVGLPDVAFGYQDGYWDTGHHWHNWQNDQQMRDYRNSPKNHYNDWLFVYIPQADRGGLLVGPVSTNGPTAGFGGGLTPGQTGLPGQGTSQGFGQGSGQGFGQGSSTPRTGVRLSPLP